MITIELRLETKRSEEIKNINKLKARQEKYHYKV